MLSPRLVGSITTLLAHCDAVGRRHPPHQKSETPNRSSEQLVKDIRRATRKQYSAEEKIRIVLDGLRGESSIAELCRREAIAESLYYSWSKEFLEAGKKPACRRYGPCCDLQGGQGPAPRGPRA